ETQRLLEITEDRAAELAVINSIQQGLAAELNFQAIVDLVGDKLREVLKTDEIGIRWYDAQTNLNHYLYEYEHGQRLAIPPGPPVAGGAWFKILETRQPFVRNTVAEREALGIAVVPGTDPSKSSVLVPIIGSDRVVGSIIVEDYEKEYAFGKSEVRLLTTVASSMGVALENARLFDETQRLLKITEDRAAELAIINSVQAALAAELNIQGIYEAVGDKVREIFDQGDVGIRIYDPKTNLVHYPYAYEHGERISIDSNTLTEQGFASHVFRTRETILINENIIHEAEKYGSYILPGTDVPKSQLMVPLVAGDQARGLIEIVDMQHEHAFSDSDVRLLQTLANSMSVALENARLFDETQRLLKETEQRNAELASINSVQNGLASKLNMQAIYELVGDKLSEITGSDIVVIARRNIEEEIRSDVYTLEKGRRLPGSEHPFTPLEKSVIPDLQQGKTIVWNDGMEERVNSFGHRHIVGDTAMPRSVIIVPLK
ncbi:MAG TPA: GAF domain-containing protein, partial [Anaerolineales bacterium]|nr:GAF domain-containing protein [Anaerolineales bacterium]